MVLSEIIDIVISYVKTYPIGSGLLGALTCSIIHQLYFYLRYIRKGAKKTTASLSTREEQPGVSVVVCARNEEENLQDYLHTLATQDYPKYEVIVVDDGRRIIRTTFWNNTFKKAITCTILSCPAVHA